MSFNVHVPYASTLVHTHSYSWFIDIHSYSIFSRLQRLAKYIYVYIYIYMIYIYIYMIYIYTQVYTNVTQRDIPPDFPDITCSKHLRDVSAQNGLDSADRWLGEFWPFWSTSILKLRSWTNIPKRDWIFYRPSVADYSVQKLLIGTHCRYLEKHIQTTYFVRVVTL